MDNLICLRYQGNHRLQLQRRTLITDRRPTVKLLPSAGLQPLLDLQPCAGLQPLVVPSADLKQPPDLQPWAGLRNRVFEGGFVRLQVGNMHTFPEKKK